MTEFNKGSELDKQIYPEGEQTWGLKSGFLDVEDVREFIKSVKELLCLEIRYLIDEKAGNKLIEEASE